MDDFSRYAYLPSSSGCSLFVIDESRNLLVAAFKKKLLVYALGETVSPSQSLVKEIALSGDSSSCSSPPRYHPEHGAAEFAPVRRSSSHVPVGGHHRRSRVQRDLRDQQQHVDSLLRAHRTARRCPRRRRNAGTRRNASRERSTRTFLRFRGKSRARGNRGPRG